jgi:putative CocE/NonD family hydrolase
VRLRPALAAVPLLAVLAAATAQAHPSARLAARPWSPRPATYGVVNQTNVPIRMADGTVLMADLHLPATSDGKPAPGRFPVILTQTPYSKSIDALSYRADFLVQRGYVQVTVDVRGTGASQGEWDSFGPKEQADSVALVAWAASQQRPWSDGRVATLGESYLAINQLFTAEHRPPALKAAFPIVPNGDAYRDVVASGGQVDVGFIPLWLGLVTSIGLVGPATGGDPQGGFTAFSDHVAGASAFQAQTVASSLSGGDNAYDGPFYAQRSPLVNIDRIQVPTFVVGGWHDLFQRSEPLIYQRLRANHVPTRLLMGPWTHTQGSTGAGLPAQGVPDLNTLALRWFDHYVRGVPDPSMDTDIAPVTWYDLGTDKWRTAQSWMGAQVRPLGLGLTGAALPGQPGGMVRGRSSGGSDPVLPLPSQGLCSRSATQWTAGAAWSGTPCESDARVDDAQATSYDLPVTEPLTLLGPVNAHLWVSTTRPDGLLALRLEDVAPDGTANALTGGWQVLSLRALDAKRSLRLGGAVVVPWHPFTKASQQDMPTGTPVPVDVEVFPTGATIAAGHVLRLSVEAFDTPHLAPPAPQLANSAGDVLSIVHDAAHQSFLTLTTMR